MQEEVQHPTDVLIVGAGMIAQSYQDELRARASCMMPT